MIATSLPGPFPWLGLGATRKGPGNEVTTIRKGKRESLN